MQSPVILRACSGGRGSGLDAGFIGTLDAFQMCLRWLRQQRVAARADTWRCKVHVILWSRPDRHVRKAWTEQSRAQRALLLSQRSGGKLWRLARLHAHACVRAGACSPELQSQTQLNSYLLLVSRDGARQQRVTGPRVRCRKPNVGPAARRARRTRGHALLPSRVVVLRDRRTSPRLPSRKRSLRAVRSGGSK